MIQNLIIVALAVGLPVGVLLWAWVLVLMQEKEIKTLKQHIKEQDTTIQKLQKLNAYDVEQIVQENEKLKFQNNDLQNLRILYRQAATRLNAENEKLSKEITQYAKIQQIVNELQADKLQQVMKEL